MEKYFFVWWETGGGERWGGGERNIDKSVVEQH